MCVAGGESSVIRQAICVHEEDGGVLWKHKDWRTDTAEVRRNRRLVLSFMCTIGNYDYGKTQHSTQTYNRHRHKRHTERAMGVAMDGLCVSVMCV
jgi:hypothetical protein